MRKYAKYVLVALLMFCCATSVNAEECSYEKQVEMGKHAATVKAVYEEVKIDTGLEYVPEGNDGPTGIQYEHGFKVKILNVTEDIILEVENGYDDSKKFYSYEDSNNGTIDLGDHLADFVYSVTIKVHGTGECRQESFRTVRLTVPRYNELSEYNVCQEYPDFEYCKEYVTTEDDISMAEFANRVEMYKKSNKSLTELKKEKEEKKISNKIVEFFKKNKKVIVISAIILIIVGVATATILIIRRRSRLI